MLCHLVLILHSLQRKLFVCVFFFFLLDRRRVGLLQLTLDVIWERTRILTSQACGKEPSVLALLARVIHLGHDSLGSRFIVGRDPLLNVSLDFCILCRRSCRKVRRLLSSHLGTTATCAKCFNQSLVQCGRTRLGACSRDYFVGCCFALLLKLRLSFEQLDELLRCLLCSLGELLHLLG